MAHVVVQFSEALINLMSLLYAARQEWVIDLASDVLSTTVDPTYADLIRLSIIAVVRTFLVNFFNNSTHWV